MSYSYGENICQPITAIEVPPDDHPDKKVQMLLKELDTVRVTNQRVSHTYVQAGGCAGVWVGMMCSYLSVCIAASGSARPQRDRAAETKSRG